MPQIKLSQSCSSISKILSNISLVIDFPFYPQSPDSIHQQVLFILSLKYILSLTIPYHLHIYFPNGVTINCHLINCILISLPLILAPSNRVSTQQSVERFLKNMTMTHPCLKLSSDFLIPNIYPCLKVSADLGGRYISDLSLLNLLCCGLRDSRAGTYVHFTQS